MKYVIASNIDGYKMYRAYNNWRGQPEDATLFDSLKHAELYVAEKLGDYAGRLYIFEVGVQVTLFSRVTL